MKKFFMDESGQGMVEYGLIIALVAVIAITAVTALGNNVSGKLSAAASALA